MPARPSKSGEVGFRPAPLRDSAVKLHDVAYPNGSARRSSWREDALGTGSTGKPPGFSHTPDLNYLAGVWEDAARRLLLAQEASLNIERGAL